ncbi:MULTISPECIES: presqualene diphosphate synthase HpnD [unclassified Amycolatopsis]|uniref:presqualene diphosphate synthase HpnD n=1 Tax=unclassified Amycolatopsis TaxID=2618356 RepID=UPI001C69B1D7|nr:presqualene diphosphate synthase HpnD [Amycolatopsis sp. DSM 110486]QYN18159.1 presqualene diphosphate synthase HpnD [Amycolatopsis sp. DSM 110486]
MSTVEEAYEHCALVTKEQARNFYYGIRLLPPDKRSALCAVYALARIVDDIGDGDLAPEAKLQGLADIRKSLGDLSASTDPVYVALADAARRYPIPLGAFDELLDGVEMDVTGREYVRFEDLVEYCRCVAGSVGRLCLGVFGSKPEPEAPTYADELGIALQQTNILRDIREDLLNGRVYLPKEDLDRFGVELKVGEDGRLADDGGGLTALVHFSAARARDWYARGLKLVPSLDRRSAACCTAMSGIYRTLLDRIDEQPSLVFDRRLSLSGREKAVVAVRALTGIGR